MFLRVKTLKQYKRVRGIEIWKDTIWNEISRLCLLHSVISNCVTFQSSDQHVTPPLCLGCAATIRRPKTAESESESIYFLLYNKRTKNSTMIRYNIHVHKRKGWRSKMPSFSHPFIKKKRKKKRRKKGRRKWNKVQYLILRERII